MTPTKEKNTQPNPLASLTTTGNLSDRIEEVLTEAIQTGHFAAGERLWVDRIADQLGVSKIPVREALRALEASGFVQSQPRRGTFVKPLTLEDLTATFEARQLVEPHCAYLAAQRRTTAQLQALEQLIEQGDLKLHPGNELVLSKNNREFHLLVAQAAHNDLLCSVLRKIQHRLRRYFIAANWHDRHATLSQHKPIFIAIRDQDADGAAQLMKEHIAYTSALAHELFERIPQLQTADHPDKADTAG